MQRTRGRLTTFLLGVTLALAILTSAVLLYRFWLSAIVLSLAIVMIITIRDNLREIWH